MLPGYNRNVSIIKNELVFIGDNAIASWGKTQEWDGRGGDQGFWVYLGLFGGADGGHDSDFYSNLVINRGLRTSRTTFVHEIAFFEKAIVVLLPGEDRAGVRHEQYRVQHPEGCDQF